MPTGTLYVVATPIGNLADITLRAIEVLRTVAVIVCEDTRRTRTLIERHGIATPLLSHHKFNEARTSPAIVRRLAGGESVAIVSDGGTPGISDPGARLVAEAVAAGITVTPVPGPSAFVAAASVSGFQGRSLTFRGFLPHRAGERRRALSAIAGDPATQIFYESPHRIVAALQDLAAILGPRMAVVGREVTKRFETWYRGPLAEIGDRIAASPAKGEFVIVVEGADPARVPLAGAGSPEGPDADAALRSAYERALASGQDRRRALLTAAEELGVSRKEAYRRLKARRG